MREIKYRVWDIRLKKMFQVESIDFSVEPIQVTYIEKDCWDEDQVSWGEVGETCILMQRTCVKDKRDKDIYEGDVMQLEGSKKKAVILFKDGSFGAYLNISDVPGGNRTHRGEFFTVVTFHRHKIIGNIYENPELNEKGDEDGN